MSNFKLPRNPADFRPPSALGPDGANLFADADSPPQEGPADAAGEENLFRTALGAAGGRGGGVLDYRLPAKRNVGPCPMAKRLDLALVIDVESTCWDTRPPRGQISEIIEIGLCTVDLRSLERREKRCLM